MALLPSAGPRRSKANQALVVTSRALGSALPISSEAIASRRRAIYKGSQPASNIRANQYRLALGSEPRTDL